MDLKLEEIASLLEVSEHTIHKWLQTGKIPGYYIKDEYRFNREEIEDWLLHDKTILEDDSEEVQDKLKDLSLKYSLYKGIYRGGVLNNIEAIDKTDILQIVSHYIADKFSLDEEVLFEMLSNREEIMSTGIGEGIAIPHAKEFLINAYYDVVVPVFLKNPIDFKALDGKPVDVLFFIFASEDKKHLSLINKVVHLGVSVEARTFLKKSPSKDDLLAYVKAWESQAYTFKN